MTRIYIENNELDITQELTHQLTFAIDDLQNIDSKATSFSKTIIIPGTAKNNQLFGNIFEFGNSNFTDDTNPNVYYNFNASKSAQARIEINGLQAMKGVMRLLSIIVDGRNVEYEIALFGEFGGFVSRILNKKLEDIDFSYLNHNWDYATITDSWNPGATYNITNTGTFNDGDNTLFIFGDNLPKLKVGDQVSITGTFSNDGIKTIIRLQRGTSAIPLIYIQFAEQLTAGTDSTFTIELLNGKFGAGYVYPLIDYGNVTYNYPSNAPTYLKHRDYTFRAFRPAIFALEYVNQIITGAGYSWESNFFNSNFFRRLIIPHNGVGLERTGVEEYVSADTNETYNQSQSNSDVVRNISWDNQPTLNDFTYNNTTKEFVFNGTTNRTLKVSGTFIGTFSSFALNVLKITFEKTDGTVIAESSIEKNITSQFQDFNVRIEGVVNILPGESIVCRLYGLRGGQSLVFYTFVCDATLTVISDPPSFVLYDYGDAINMNDTIPRNYYQKDFFTSILKMFNLMVVEDKAKERHLKIEPYVDFFQLDRDTYLDWSDKVNRDKPISIKPMAEANARIYEFKYKQDNDFFNEEYRKKFNESYGNRTFDNQLEFSKDSQSLEVIFSSSVLVGYQGFDKVAATIYKKNNDVEESIAHNIRIMQCKKIEAVDSWSITVNNAAVGAALTDYLYAGHFNDPDFPTSDLNFGATKELKFELLQGALQNNLFNAFYSPYMAEIIDKDSRIVTCEMYLTERDIFNLDFSRFIMFDGVLYRLEKIIDWSETNLCKVELLRCINTTYQALVGSGRYLKLSFTDISTLPTDIGGWNTLFDLPAYGSTFNVFEIEGNDVYLYGADRIRIKNSLFENDTNIIAIDDKAACIIEVEDRAFADCTNLNFVNMQGCEFIGVSSFNGSVNITNINLSSCINLGGTRGNDSVFASIVGNNITASFNRVLQTNNSGDADGDIKDLTSNNTVNITYI